MVYILLWNGNGVMRTTINEYLGGILHIIVNLYKILTVSVLLSTFIGEETEKLHE